ncbi:hypothetical protein [Aquipuribacter nitratireducens]|uniref:STAS domain-containing protein n=1 Tax=Aquipuribacter nitratireducens TaxID=650104 RepID=A0ABW0GQ10_9MICO
MIVAVAVVTHNLAYGVVAGVLTAMVLFARRVAHLAEVTSVTDPDGNHVVFSVHGELSFASSNDLVYRFDYACDPDDVVIDLSQTHVRYASSVAALDAVTSTFARRGKIVTTDLTERSATMHSRPPGSCRQPLSEACGTVGGCATCRAGGARRRRRGRSARPAARRA